MLVGLNPFIYWLSWLHCNYRKGWCWWGWTRLFTGCRGSWSRWSTSASQRPCTQSSSPSLLGTRARSCRTPTPLSSSASCSCTESPSSLSASCLAHSSTKVCSLIQYMLNYLYRDISTISIYIVEILSYYMNSPSSFTFSLIRHIAITICPFRFAFSHLPRCGQLLQQKDRKNFTWNLCARFS